MELLTNLFMPPGYPATTTPDYLPYQLWSMPTHITGNLSHSLTTSSLLSAVGISAGPAGTVAASAGIRWIIKDGIGALGRLVIGTRFANEFDEDPRRWRMVAELVSTVGLALEVATSVYPQNFLLLACSGNFCIALGKGMGKPVFRVIQTHFASASNVGAVAAKEEVWEVTAKMMGLACSVALLRALEEAGNGDPVWVTWIGIQLVHIGLRYQALGTLRFSSINQKRLASLALAAAAGRPLPGVDAANAAEPMLLDSHTVAPRMHFGCSAAEAFGGAAAAAEALRRPGANGLAGLYAGEGYLLVWRNRTAHVLLKDEPHSATPSGSPSPKPKSRGSNSGGSTRLLRAAYQAAWLELHRPGAGPGDLEALAASLEAMLRGFPAFEAGLQAAGWDIGSQPIKVGSARLQVVPRAAAAAAVPASG